jgi:hypothetical protein
LNQGFFFQVYGLERLATFSIFWAMFFEFTLKISNIFQFFLSPLCENSPKKKMLLQEFVK